MRHLARNQIADHSRLSFLAELHERFSQPYSYGVAQSPSQSWKVHALSELVLEEW